MTQTVSLGDIVNIRSGKSRPKQEGDFPVYGGNGIFDSAPTPNVTAPAIIVGRVGAYCGSVYIERDSFWLSDNALGVTVKDGASLDFVFYLLKSMDLNRKAVGGAQPLLTQGILNSISVTIPDLETQKKIADILGTIDEKIELNRQMNETLEQMGQALFRHYFIDNPEAEKWEDGIISDLGEVITGKTPSKSKTEYYGNDVMFLKVPDMHGQSIIIKTEDNLSVAGADTQPKKYIPKWSTCVSCIATVGVVSLAGDTLQTNQQINSVIPKSEEYAIFNYYLMKSKSELLKTMASGGSATPNLNKGHFEKVSIALPPDDILEAFHDKAKGMLEIVYENTRQIQTLTTLRDTLLPRLINGKAKI